MYRISLQDFEGPLDLLLYFIRRDELDIFNIPIAQIADEYLEYVRLLENIDLDSVGDFLYMAALLINIKARMLLPKPELDDEGEPIDPRRELVERLLEYVRYKEASSHLTGLYEDRSDRFTRGHASSEREKWESQSEISYNASVFDLIGALRRILTEAPEEPTHAVVREEYHIEEQQAFILAELARIGKISFVETMRGRSKAFIITTFLGILELAREQRVWLLISEDGPADFYLEERIPEEESGPDSIENVPDAVAEQEDVSSSEVEPGTDD